MSDFGVEGECCECIDFLVVCYDWFVYVCSFLFLGGF